MTISRRQMIQGLGAAGFAALGTPADVLARVTGRDGPALAAEVTLACAALTWGGNDRQAIDDVAAAGYRGIQLRTSALTEFGTNPSALKDLLASKTLALPVFSSGAVSIDPAKELATLQTHGSNAKFLRAAGGLMLQVMDEKPQGREPNRDDHLRAAKLLNELGARCNDLGITLVYHHHMGSAGERPEAIRELFGATDPKLVKLLLDVAHYQQGGGDPIAAIHEYKDRIAVMHLKDVEPRPGSTPNYRFVELGRGKVDLAGVVKAMNAINYKGWAVIELDAVPDPSPTRTPKSCAEANIAFATTTLGFKK